MRIMRWLVVLGLVAAGGLYVMARPNPLAASAVADLTGDAAKGELVFWAAGCASCHMADKAEGEAQKVLTGGQAFATQFGTFYAPNISPDPENGIGGWDLATFVHAVQAGISPEGAHCHPAMPHTAYAPLGPQAVGNEAGGD